jgi:hypothetical protein
MRVADVDYFASVDDSQPFARDGLDNRRNNYDADEGRELFASEGTCIAGLRHINEQYLCRGANRTTQALAG